MKGLGLCGRNDLGTYKHANKWTPIAEECYRRACKCEGCPENKIIQISETGDYCHVKPLVLELVRRYGAPKPKSPRGKSVRNIDTGEVFLTVKEAAKKYNLKDSRSITHAIWSGGRCRGFRWEYAERMESSKNEI